MESKSTRTAGSLKVSEQVVGKIARLAASEVKGVALCEKGQRPARAEKSFLPRKFSALASPVKVRFSQEAAEIDISIITLQGHKAATTGENVQQAIKKAVQNMTGIAVSKVNVKIEGVRLTENER
ncbi:MAG: Asp23/Gls24 family envelope stress response protein [Oscillospiraceae bacterium]|nr:Asp23/Gls24 family envelope stress response protein [Oscillospiraceae bacterium]